MRVAQNPVKKVAPAYSPSRVGVASITFAPVLDGFFKDMLEVIDVHLSTLYETTRGNCDVLVFDNGSCEQVTSFLAERREAGFIDWLVLSKHNLGKTGAINWIFAAMPNEFVVFSDSDIFFRPGWLEESLEIFDSFERAGIVGGQPAFMDVLRGEGKTGREIAAHAPGLRVEEIDPNPKALEEYLNSTNKPEELRREISHRRLKLAVNQEKGVRAVVGCSHSQFMLRRELARKLVPLPVTGALRQRDDEQINRRTEELGYWQLSLEKPLVVHMGNRIRGSGNPEIEDYLQRQRRKRGKWKEKHIAKMRAAPGLWPRLKSLIRLLIARSSLLRAFLSKLYGSLFGLLYEEY